MEKNNIIFLHHPTVFSKPIISKEIKPIIMKLSKYGKVYNYFFKFHGNNKFELKDLLFENVAEDINYTFKHLNRYFIVAYEHACPMALYFVNRYPKKIAGIICYPFRYYSLESYKRRVWKLKDNKGWESLVKDNKYDVDKYLFKINDKRFQELFIKNLSNNDVEKTIIHLVFDINLQKQYHKIPKKFKVPTVLYTRLDLDEKLVVKHNYDRKDIAKMKKLFSENDALQSSMIWNFERVKYDAKLKKENKNTNNLKIKYLITGWEDNNDIIDEVILFKFKFF
jgi:hypothetical protein